MHNSLQFALQLAHNLKNALNFHQHNTAHNVWGS